MKYCHNCEYNNTDKCPLKDLPTDDTVATVCYVYEEIEDEN